MPNDRLVHVIDDDEAVRDSLQFLLGAVGIATRTHESALAFLERPAGTEIACVITDIRMPGMSGIDLLKNLRDRGILAPVIMVTGHGDVPLAVAAMKLGAADFLEKPFDDEVLLSTVRAALDRQDRAGEQETKKGEFRERLAKLSDRERQVLAGLVAGNPNKTIAYDLGISPRTVEVYRANVMSKMQAASLSELVRMTLIAGEGTG